MDANLKVKLIALSILLVSGNYAVAGNKGIIENRVQELDKLNKQVVTQSGALPSDGRIDLKAYVIQNGETPIIQIVEKSVTIKEETIDFKPGDVTVPPPAETVSKEQPDENKSE